MKLVTFVRLDQERLGLLAGDTVIDPLLASGDKAIFANTLSFIKSKSDHQRDWQFRRKDGTVFAAEVIAAKMPDDMAMVDFKPGNTYADFDPHIDKDRAHPARDRYREGLG